MNMKKNDMKFSDSIMAKYFVLAAIGVMAILLVVIVHKWRHNTLLSVAGGTLVYMLMVQVMFS